MMLISCTLTWMRLDCGGAGLHMCAATRCVPRDPIPLHQPSSNTASLVTSSGLVICLVLRNPWQILAHR